MPPGRYPFGYYAHRPSAKGELMGHVDVAPFDLSRMLEPALAVMTAAFGLSESGSRERMRVVARHAGRPGLITRGAFTRDDQLIGFCYGFPSDDGAWWERQIRPHLIRSGTVEWLAGGAFELTELHVHPEHQGRGLGRRLITEVLTRTDRPRALLSVRAEDDRARRLYVSVGFRDLTEPFQFGPGQPPYAVMGCLLPVTRPAPCTASALRS